MQLITDHDPWYVRLKLFRIKAGLTQMDMAAKLEVGHRRYWGWEKGQNVPRDSYQAKIAEALVVDQEAIFGGAVQDFAGLERRRE